MKLALFDFDGTLTKKDSFVSYFSFVNGRSTFILKSLSIIHYILGYYLKIISGERLKEKYLQILVRDKSKVEMQKHTARYVQEASSSILGTQVYNQMLKFKSDGFRCIVVSASMDIWLDEWCRINECEVICTKAEVVNGKYTGRLSTPDCVGNEKVIRIRQHIALENYDTIAAYGNAADSDMLALASNNDLRVLI